MTIPSPSMLHLIACVRTESYTPIERYRDEAVLFDDIAAAYQKAVLAFYDAGCRYLQLDDTSWGEFCDEDKREAYAKRGFDLDRIAKEYVKVLNKVLAVKPRIWSLPCISAAAISVPPGFSSGGYGPIAKTLFAHCPVDGFFLEYDTDRAGDFNPLHHIKDQKVVLGLVTSKIGRP